MPKSFACVTLVILGLVGSSAFGQAQSSRTPRLPLKLDRSKFPSSNPIPMHLKFNKISADGNAAISLAGSGGPDRIVSVPHFSSSFTYQNQVYPFTIMGHGPSKGGTTSVETQYVPISFFFDEFVDNNGNNIVIDANAITDEIKESPNFENFGYSTGFTQFGDAVQRAEFYSVIQNEHGKDAWHTLLDQPVTLIPVQVEVPFGSSVVFTDGTNFFAFIDINFMVSQLNTLAQTEGLGIGSVPILLTHNAVYADFFFGGCCIGGFHTAFETGQKGNTHFVQVFDFATSLDAAVANDIFGDPTVFADVEALSHEVSETMDDPFVNNVVPPWQFPNLPPGVCSNALETGDPVENLPNPSFPVMLHGFTYHPQTEALLQWFSRQSPSTQPMSIGGAFSYPDTTILPHTSTPCGTPF
jgi:hypothetical protein